MLTGPIAYLHEGEELLVHGSWREHPRHGRRFEVARRGARGADDREPA